MFLRYTALAAVLFVLSYGFIKAWPLVSGPQIRLQTLTYGTTPGVVTLSGRALHTETLTLNGGILLIDGEGDFEKTLTLPQGGVILSLTATDRFGRSSYERRTLLTP